MTSTPQGQLAVHAVEGEVTAARPARRKPQFAGIDLIRILAACLVVLFHLSFWQFRDPLLHQPVPASLARWEPLSACGWVGVEIFFVLSGFVITYSSEDVVPGAFLKHRVLRLLPGTLICASLTGLSLIGRASKLDILTRWLTSVSCWPVGPWIDGVYWTLPIEVAFYLLVAGGLRLWGDRLSDKLFLALGLWSGCASMLANLHPAWIPAGWVSWISLSTLPPQACTLVLYGDFFALGALLFVSCRHGWTAARGTVVLVCLGGCFAELLSHADGIAAMTQQPSRRFLPLSIWAVAVALLPLSTYQAQRVHGIVGTRGARLLRKAALATYPLYLLHSSIGNQTMTWAHGWVDDAWAFLFAFMVVTALALFVSEKGEPIVRSWLRLRVSQLHTSRIFGPAARDGIGPGRL